jgi:Delta7-sterol 5-desaturase
MADDKERKRISGWHYMPAVPVKVSPVFRLPFRPIDIFLWFWRSWFLISERLILVAVACISWFYFQPAFERSQTWAFDWVFEMWVRNIILMTLVAGSLHLFFYTFKKQGKEKKYDPRDLAKSNRSFTLKNQVWDNMFWTLGSGVAIWTAFEALMFWALANGYAPMITWAANPIWFVVLFFLIPIWESFYFYWMHRLFHVPALYKTAHSLHHRNINVGPWSGLSMHPLEHLFFLGSVVIHFVVACHPIHILFHLQYFALTAATTHCGFEGVVIKDKTRLSLGTFHHQMHHRYFDCNYGSLEIPWDKWFGSFHDGTPEAHEVIRERRQRMASSNK